MSDVLDDSFGSDAVAEKSFDFKEGPHPADLDIVLTTLDELIEKAENTENDPLDAADLRAHFNHVRSNLWDFYQTYYL